MTVLSYALAVCLTFTAVQFIRPVGIVTAYILSMSFVTFLYCGFDKHAAQKGNYRLSERFLLTTALLGGSPGLLMGMTLFRHKTKKAKFLFFVAVIACIQLLIASGVLAD